MTYFPDGFNPRDDVIHAFQLCEVEAATGTARFMVGTDGIFTDIHGRAWYGSQLFAMGELEVALNGNAPTGEISLSYFQDPDQPDLIANIRASGDAEVDGRAIRFYIQPFTAPEQMQAPTVPPIVFATRTMRAVVFQRTGATQRRIAVTFEGPWEARARSRRLQYTTADHARLTGSANPSLELMPQDNQQQEKLWA